MNSIKCRELLYSLKREDLKIIDVRSSSEFSKGHIPSSFNIPKKLLLSKYILYLNKDYTYYIICKFGDSSQEVCLFLLKKGYNVINVSDGFINWQGEIEKARKFN